MRLGADGAVLYANAAARAWLERYGGLPVAVEQRLRGPAGEERFELVLAPSVYEVHVARQDDASVDVYVTDVTRAHAVARFPDRNPHPVLRVSSEGVLLYANVASARVIDALGVRVGAPVGQGFWTQVHAAAASGAPLEVGAGTRVYELLCVHVPELEAYNLYGTDVTAARALEAAREAFIRSERLAALGRMVAGLAHELNTPIGVALTAATVVEDHVAEVRGALEGQSLSRSRLQKCLDGTAESAAIVVRGAQRAAELVRRFKGIAADQVSEQARAVPLRDHLREILAAVAPMLRKERIDAHAEGDEVVVTTYPSALAQIVDNFVTNASAHAYPDGAGGALRFRVQALAQGGAALVIEDDGLGMDAETLRSAYEPFFTTRRGRGGTGLGLHIVHNLVVGPLGGTIRTESTPGQGTRTVITLPTRPPDP
jgi:signal transduction histidine kinase